MKNVYLTGVWYACYMKLYLDDTVKFTMNEVLIHFLTLMNMPDVFGPKWLFW